MNLGINVTDRTQAVKRELHWALSKNGGFSSGGCVLDSKK